MSSLVSWINEICEECNQWAEITSGFTTSSSAGGAKEHSPGQSERSERRPGVAWGISAGWRVFLPLARTVKARI